MEYLRLKNIVKENEIGIEPYVGMALDRLEEAQKSFPRIVLDIATNGQLERRIELTNQQIRNNPRTNPNDPLAEAASGYFAAFDAIGYFQESQIVNYVNKAGQKNSPKTWQTRKDKIKLGTGIGLIEAPPVYKKLRQIGVENPRLSLNYGAPGGTLETRRGIKALMDSKIDPEGDFFPENGIFLTEGCTGAIDLFIEWLSLAYPSSRLVNLGLSYYAAPFSAKLRGLQIDRLVANPIKISEKTEFFPSADDVTRSLATDTKAIQLTVPNNPNGEIYSKEEIQKILQLAVERDIFILFDGIFEDMYFDEENNFKSNILQIAKELGALNRIIFVSSFSKIANFPGERIGWLATTNPEVIAGISTLSIARRCNPPLTLEPLIQFEGLARTVITTQTRNPNRSLNSIISKAFNGDNYPFDRRVFKEMYLEWKFWQEQVMKYYKSNLEMTRILLGGLIDAGSPDKAAFNTLVRLSCLSPGTNCMDYIAKLMFTMALFTQVGPCFGLSQKAWDENLGVWVRITYSYSRNDLIEALTRLIIYTRTYAEKDLGNPNQFPVLDINYQNQK